MTVGRYSSDPLERLQYEVSVRNTDIEKRLKALEYERKEYMLARQRPPMYGGGEYSSRAATQSDETKALLNWMRKGGDINAIQEDERRLIDYNRMDTSGYDTERKAALEASADLGGFWGGFDVSERIIQKMFLTSPIRQYAAVERIGGQALFLPSEGSVDTSVAWTDEQQAFTASPDVTVGMVEIWAREISGYIRVSKTLLEDAVFDLEGFVIGRLARQFALKQGQAFLSGNGVSRPAGIYTAIASGQIPAAQVYTCSDSTNHTILPQDVINTLHKVKSQYRSTGVWMASNATIGAMRLFEDTVARPIWQAFGDTFRETLYGIPIIEMPDMTNPQGTFTSTGTHPGGQAKYLAGDIPLIFASLKDGYTIVDRVGVTFQKLQELFALSNQVAFLARARVGGAVVLPEAFGCLKIA
jgi:HK97 family phage major capsid protein